MVNFILTNDAVTVIINGYPIQIQKDNSLYKKVVFHLRDENITEEELLKILEREVKIQTEDITITQKDGEVFVNDQPVHPELQNRINIFVDNGLPIKSLLKFIKKLYANPSVDSQQSLLDFLCHNNLPIHEDGDFLAYKAVRHDLTDIWTGTIQNDIGQLIRTKRENVDPNRSVGCSRGYHVGTIDYAKGYCPGDGFIMLVKVNPKDVVSVPYDCDCQKLRTCAYTVYDVYKNDLSNPLYKDAETPIAGKYDKIKKFKEDTVDKFEKSGIIAWANQFGDMICIDTNQGMCEKPNISTKKPKTNTYNKRDSKGRFCK